MPNACPCGEPAPYDDCCGPYIAGHAHAPDAAALMRSRYSAYVVGARDYLLATWHPSTRPGEFVLATGTKWLGLDVREYLRDPADPDRASVEFVARSRIGGRGVRLHETSRFVREGDHWYYVDGMQHRR